MSRNYKEIQEVADIFDLSFQAVYKWIKADKIDEEYLNKVPSRGRSGSKYLMDPMGAPEPHRSRWIREQAKKAPNPRREEIDAEIYAGLKDYQKEFVDLWLNLFQQFGHLKGNKLKQALSIYREENPDVKGLSYGNYRKNKNKYDDYGISPNGGLAPEWGKRDGDSIIPDKYFDIYKDYYLKESRPPHHDCWKKTRGAAWDADDLIVQDGNLWITDEDGNAERRWPHPRTFKRRLEKEYTESDIYLARYGKSKWKQKYANNVTRDKSSIPAGYCWVGDHRQLDTTVYNEETGREYRPWITAWMDFKTGKWLSWYIHEEAPNSDHIFMSFKWCVEKYGKPEAIYIDNGRDYLSNDFAGNQIWNKNADIDDDHKAMISLLDINAQIAIPKNAQAKNIEPRFRTLIRGIEKHTTGYTGSKASDRPEGHVKQIKNREIMEASEHEKLVSDYMTKVLNREPSQGREHNGLSPNELWNKEYDQKKVVHPDTLKLLCMRTSNDLTIGKNGIYDSKIKRHYWGEWMMENKGRKVYMRRDIKKYDKAYVFDAETGEYIDKADLDLVVSGIIMDDVDRRDLRIKLAQMRREERRANEILKARGQHSNDEVLRHAIANADAHEAVKKSTGDFIDDQTPDEVAADTKADKIRKDVNRSEEAKQAKEDLEIIAPDESEGKSKLAGIFDD